MGRNNTDLSGRSSKIQWGTTLIYFLSPDAVEFSSGVIESPCELRCSETWKKLPIISNEHWIVRDIGGNVNKK